MRYRNGLAAAMIVCAGCGSASDLVIGSQAPVEVEAGFPGPSCGDAGKWGKLDGSDQVGEAADGTIGPIGDGGCSNPALCAVLKAELRGDGTLFLAGGPTDEYVDLPNGIVRPLVNATFEAWVTWYGCGGWERIFDFGDSGNPENVRGYASTTLYLTPQSMNGRDVMFGAFKRANQDALYETRASSNQPLATGTMSHVALVVDDTNNLMSLYRNGVFEGSVAFGDSLSLLNDINNWLGRSQYVVDPSFSGTFHEFRIYNVALPAPAIQTSFFGGADPTFLD